MVKIYTTNSCSSCKKAVKWLKDNNIPYQEINFFSQKLTKKMLFEILESSENGFDDIISKRSKSFTENNLDINKMSFNELVDFILKNPSILKRPIIIEDKKFQIGYNDEEIRLFVPRNLRQKLSQLSCCNTDDCNYVTEFKDSIID